MHGRGAAPRVPQATAEALAPLASQVGHELRPWQPGRGDGDWKRYELQRIQWITGPYLEMDMGLYVGRGLWPLLKYWPRHPLVETRKPPQKKRGTSNKGHMIVTWSLYRVFVGGALDCGWGVPGNPQT